MSRSFEDWEAERLCALRVKKLLFDAKVQLEYMIQNDYSELIDDVHDRIDSAVSQVNSLIGLNTMTWELD